MRKLFLSLTATLAGMQNGSVSDADLKTGLFLFGCVKQDALRANVRVPGSDDQGNQAWSGVPVSWHEKLAVALMEAESEGRASWTRPTVDQRLNDTNVLNSVLLRSGMATLPPPQDGRRFTYQGIMEAIRELSMPLQPVF